MERLKVVTPLFKEALEAWRKMGERQEKQAGTREDGQGKEEIKGIPPLTEEEREDVFRQLIQLEALPPEAWRTANAFYMRATLKWELGELGDTVRDLRQGDVVHYVN